MYPLLRSELDYPLESNFTVWFVVPHQCTILPEPEPKTHTTTPQHSRLAEMM
ncbi:hypothetical protein SNOG_01977 [Parastagonospora nodorum SN15]|uniref:Uncharacterized protein n=1 Tax=Phaeosphaeria nodorum (strain SN15 / ATCC MYA-4574 / FGSC 10173) TaxID=321614 RepID=Q0V1Y7_PHANO|nr:hypothetical protein SNOG_01977 [Parastagonospora nodorum SN15]EAT90189.1 hypothetical protein SNOG_01977 [Parastagonospora nodorum SN15]